MENILQDLRYGIRMMLKTPAFTAVAVLALALGIGTNTAIFSIINGVLLKPLGFKDPDRLVKVWEDWGGFEKGSVAYLNFQDWRERNRSFDKMCTYRRGIDFTLTGGEVPERVSGWEVSADFLSVLGVAPALGRDFREDEDRLGANLVAVISNGLWQRRFGSDPSIIGKTVILNGDSYSIIGVLSHDFHFYNNADVYVSIRAKKNILLDERSFHPGNHLVA